MRVDLGPVARRGASAFLIATATSARASAVESRPKVRLEVHRAPAAESCAGQRDIEQAVAERLGYDPFDGAAHEVLRVELVPRGSDLVARIDRLDASGAGAGSRELTSSAPDCKELSASVALAISIALDPSRALLAPPAPPAVAEPVPSSLPPAPRARRSPPRDLVVPPRRRAEERAVRVSVGADAHGAVGSAPGPAFGFGVQSAVRFRRVELGLEGRADLPASTRAAHGGEVSGQALFASFVPCVGIGWFLGCGVASAGALLGSASDSPAGGRDATPFGGAGLRAAVDLPLGARLTLRPYVEAEAAFARTSLVYGGRVAWRAPPAFGYGGVAARVALF
jgi:hypothetical protein